MLILILIISTIIAIIGGVLAENDDNIIAMILSLVSTLVIIGSSIVLIILIISFPYNVDKKLPMYEEENQKIETKIKETIQSYMNYEQETYSKLVENSHLETLLIKYPELNSNELVKSEIETYKENSKKIKGLKEAQINKSTMAWWLYFGK